MTIRSTRPDYVVTVVATPPPRTERATCRTMATKTNSHEPRATHSQVLPMLSTMGRLSTLPRYIPATEYMFKPELVVRASTAAAPARS